MPPKQAAFYGSMRQREEPGAPAGDPRRGDSGLLLAKPFYRAGKDDSLLLGLNLFKEVWWWWWWEGREVGHFPGTIYLPTED